MPPYRTLADLPAARVGRCDRHERRAMLQAFNRACAQYGRDEHRAFAVARAAARHAAAQRAGAKERGESCRA